MKSLGTWLLILAISVFGVEVCAVAAQGPDEARTEEARAYFRAGIAASRSERWEAARNAFRQSYELSERPGHLLNLARAETNIGDLVEARDHYRLFLETSDASERRRHEGAVREALEALDARIPTVTVRAAHVEGDVANIDDREVALDEAIGVNPGTHSITIVRGGDTIARDSVEVAEGANETVELDLRVPSPREIAVDQQRAPDLLDPDPESVTPPEAESRSVARSPWFWTAVIVVAGGAATATWFLLRDPPDGFVGNFGSGRWQSGAGGPHMGSLPSAPD